MNEKTMYKISYGLFVLTTRQNEKDNGCIINTVTQVTAKPNRITIAVNKSNFTHDMMMASRKCNISILSERAQMSVFQRFGFQSGREVDKFAGYDSVKRSENGIIYVAEGTNAYLSAQIEDTIDLGTHTLFIASVTDMDILNEDASVTYAFYQEQIKPKAKQESSPSNGKTKWRCIICGYEYEGEELPEDFICPICKHPVTDFEKVT